MAERHPSEATTRSPVKSTTKLEVLGSGERGLKLRNAKMNVKACQSFVL